MSFKNIKEEIDFYDDIINSHHDAIDHHMVRIDTLVKHIHEIRLKIIKLKEKMLENDGFLLDF
jgi:hypothetical protein